jgi:predicted AlkP superfamily phosphohydrolase/phosphomutase
LVLKDNQKKLPQKTLVIGLDMGDGELVRKWAKSGYLKNFKTLIDRGHWGRLNTPADTLHVSAWPSLYTGTSPGSHGVYYTFQALKGYQAPQRIKISQYGKPPVWKIINDAGISSIIMDAPYTFPIEDFNGIQIFEWGTWAWYWKPMSVPDVIWDKIKGNCGSYPLGYEANKIGLGALPLRKLRDRLVKSAKKKGRAASWLLSNHSWEFAWIVFGETHPAGHYLCYSDKQIVKSSEYCKYVYGAIDQAIGDILKSVGDGVQLFIVSGDGVGPNNAGWHLLPEILKQAGYLVEPSDSDCQGDHSNTKGNGARRDPIKQLRGLIPEKFRQAVSRRLPSGLRDRLTARWSSSGFDWERTRAYCLPTDLEGCIRINLKGREPFGIVESGGEYERLCDELVNLLSGLRDKQTRQHIVKQVIKVRECFKGDKLDDLPDIVVRWNSDQEINSVYDSQFRLNAKGRSPDMRTGTHMPPGFVLSAGEAISGCFIPANGDVVDLAPTLLDLMGVQVPSYMRGQKWLH